MDVKKIKQDDLDEVISLKKIENIHFFRVSLSFIDLSEKFFSNCIFEKCNLSNTNLKETTLNNIVFIKSKIMGVKFSEINKDISYFNFERPKISNYCFNFVDCNISMSCFYKMKLQNTSFKNSEIIDCDFTGTDLEEVDFSSCNLEKTIFLKTNLEKTNFKQAFNFAIDPTINNLKKTNFSSDNVILLLSHLDIEID